MGILYVSTLNRPIKSLDFFINEMKNVNACK